MFPVVKWKEEKGREALAQERRALRTVGSSCWSGKDAQVSSVLPYTLGTFKWCYIMHFGTPVEKYTSCVTSCFEGTQNKILRKVLRYTSFNLNSVVIAKIPYRRKSNKPLCTIKIKLLYLYGDTYSNFPSPPPPSSLSMHPNSI